MNQNSNVLYHHGILGQRWGIRRFQNPDGSLTARGKQRYDENPHHTESEPRDAKRGLSDKQKKILKAALVVGGTVAISYAGYQIAKNPQVRASLNKALNKASKTPISQINLGDIGGSSKSIISRSGKTISEIDRKMVSSINKGNTGPEGRINCFHTSTSYILNRMFGKDTIAKGFSGVDEFSGVRSSGRSKDLFKAIFSGLNEITPSESSAYDAMSKHIPKDSMGVIFVKNSKNGQGHFFNYESTKNGIVTLIDAQVDSIAELGPYVNKMFTKDVTIFDFSNAEMRANAEEILKNIVS